MHNIKIFKKITAAALLIILIFSDPMSSLYVSAVTESDQYDTSNAIHISTVDDFLFFAKNCALDTWSQNKIFLLDSDIDLSESDFESVPTFGGIFFGQGHVIKGLSLTGGSDHTGLFRYVQESGEIYQLSVSGTASAEGGHSGLSLLCGCNSGLLSGCTTSGNVTGKDQVGSMVGVNELTGVITDCVSNGSVYGRHLVGGIAGSNHGSILNCYNHCFINTTASDNNLDLSNLDIDAALDDFLTTENAASVTDIGGIAGASSGVIRACTNDGSIGYQHVGYNIGGITGSQTGYIEGCINYGVLNGRKDVGGIAGQMEPSSELEFYEDILAQLNTELDKLHQLLTQLDNDASTSSSALTGQVDQLLTSVEGAQNAVDELLGNASGYFNDVSGLTDLTRLPSPRPVSLDFLDNLASASPSPTAIPDASATPTASTEPTASPTVTPAATPTVTPVTGPDETDTEGSNNSNAFETDDLQGQLSMPVYAEQGQFVPESLSANAPVSIGALLMEPDTNDVPEPAPIAATATPTAEPPATPSATHAFEWPSAWPTISGNNIPDIDREQVENYINETQEHVYEDANETLEALQGGLRNQASIISSRILASRNSLSSSFSAIISDMRLLNSMLDDENQILLDDFQAIIDELNVIADLLTDPDASNSNISDPEDIFTDVSDLDQLTDTTGKVMNCINNGIINGDLNVGGIAGSLSRENDLDPEDDLDLGKNDPTLNFRFKERIVIRQCKNTGKVIGKKDCVGGIAGEMSLGSIMDCISSGTITSEGSMIGGIAGCSASTIRQSSAKCTLSGNDQVGGIAGYGTNILGCYSMVQIREGEYYLGSIAGKISSDAVISNNYFVEGCPAGIDGISYEEQAQPLSYETFMASPDLPDIFKNIYLTFAADEKTVAVVTLGYGDTFDPASLPQIPSKEGYVGSWEEFDQTSITSDQTIEAIYTEYITTLESSQTFGERPLVLVEGIFGPEDGFTLSSIDAYPEDSLTKSECYKITMTGTSTGPYTIRYLIPSEMEHPQIELYEDGSFKMIDAEIDGSYYVFATDQSSIVFSCTDRPSTFASGTIIVLLTGAAAVIILVTILLIRKKRGISS